MHSPLSPKHATELVCIFQLACGQEHQIYINVPKLKQQKPQTNWNLHNHGGHLWEHNMCLNCNNTNPIKSDWMTLWASHCALSLQHNLPLSHQIWLNDFLGKSLCTFPAVQSSPIPSNLIQQNNEGAETNHGGQQQPQSTTTHIHGNKKTWVTYA